MSFMRLLSLLVVFMLGEAAMAASAQNQPANVPEGLAGNYLAGRMASGYKDLDASATYLKKALQFDPKNAELQSRTFVVLVASGRIEESLQLAAALKGQKDTDKLLRLVQAVDAFRRDKYAEVTKNTQVPRGPVTDITGGLLTAWAIYGQGKPKEAIALLDRLKGPGWYAVFRDYHAGLIAELSSDTVEAGKRFERAYKAEGKVLRVVQAYAARLARQGNKTQAIETVNKFLERVPDNSLMVKLKADIEAGQAIEPLVDTPVHGASEALFGLGSALAQNGGDELAAIYLQLALHLDDKNVLSIISLADLYAQLKQPEKMIETLQRVPEDSPLKSSAEIQLAVALDGQERTDEALKHLDALIARDARNMEAQVTKGNILRAHKRFAEAQTSYDNAIALIDKPQPRHWMLYYFRGITYERNKQWPKAEADLKLALELMPPETHPKNRASVLNYLGYSWIDQGINLEAGMDMLKRAVKQDPDNGYVIDSVGWAYYRIGKYDEAVSWLEQAIAKRPADPVLNDHLGDAYWKAGRQLEAYFQWRHAKDMKPEPSDLTRIEAKLKNGLNRETEAKPTIEMKTENGPAGKPGFFQQ